MSSLLVTVCGLACGGMTLVGVSGSGTSTSLGGSGTATSTSTGTSSASSNAPTSSGSSGSESGSTTGCGFLDCSESDGGEEWPPCDAWGQDCPEGYKCTLAASPENYGWWDGTRCVMIDPDPQAPGEVCVATGPLTGVDNCELGSLCWDVDPESHEGLCVAFCGGSVEGPLCPREHTCDSLTRGGPNAGLCLPNCDPIKSDCPGDELCLPFDESWICVLDASGEQGAFGDPCEFANACDPGLYCLNPEYVPECQASGCCSPFCDTGEPNTCPSALQDCLPWYEEGQAPGGYEHIGICGIPN